MESRESQRDKRVQDVLSGRAAGGGDSPSASVMRAREELQGIEAERAANLERQKILAQSRRNQLNTMRQAATLGAAGSMGGQQVAPVQQQVATMNPQTQAILQKYGVKPGPKVSTTTTQQNGPNIRTTNTTTNNVRNEIRIVQPQIPMRQQQIPVSGQQKSGSLDKFKAWLDSSFAKQATDYEIQQKEYRKREWNLARNSSKLFQKLTESTKSLGEKMDPKNMGASLGGQLKTLLFLFLASTISKWWNPLMERITSIEAGFRSAFGLPMPANLKNGAWGASGVSFVDKIKEFIGIDTRSEKGRNTSLVEGIKNVFSDGIDRLIDTLKLFVEDRRMALQKITMPEFSLPKTDMNPISSALSGALQGVMAPTTEYLGKILSARIGGSSGLASKAASNVKTLAKQNMTRSYGGQYYTSGSTDMLGNLKDDSTYGMSMMMSRNLSDRSGQLHTGQIMTGMSMLEGNAKKSGGAVVSPMFLKQLGVSDEAMAGLVQSGQASMVPMKLVKVPKSEAERAEYSGGNWGQYVGNSLVENSLIGSLIGGATSKTARGTGKAAVSAGKLVKKGFGRGLVTKGLGLVGKLGKIPGLGWAGAALGAGASVVGGLMDYSDANEGNSDFVWKAVPLSDKRPGSKTNLLRITPEGFDALKRSMGVESFNTDDVSFQRFVESRERALKAAKGYRGKLVQDSGMDALMKANAMRDSYNAEQKKIWTRRNGDQGDFSVFRDNTSRAMSSTFYWAASKLNDLSFKMTGQINAAHIPAGQARENALRGIRYLMTKYGLSKEAAAGIAGVIQRESGWNPGAQNQQEKAKGLKFGRGLCQWSNNWGTKVFPAWYKATYGEYKYPDEVPLEHQLDFLMSGISEDGIKRDFLAAIRKPGVTLEEATKAMLLGYENGSTKMATFGDLMKVKAYGGLDGVTKMYKDRASASLGFYNLIGGEGGAGFRQGSNGSYLLSEDATDGSEGLWEVSMTMGNNRSLNNLKLADIQDISETIVGKEISDSLMLGDWYVGRSIKYLVSHASRKSTGYCAKHVRLSLEAGGISTKNHPAAATDYLSFLTKIGFGRISEKVPLQPGDITVLPAGGTHKYGHICMFTGKAWVSDFVQKNMNVYESGWPYVRFRYTGKGGTTAESTGFMESISDAAGTLVNAGAKAIGVAASAVEGSADAVNPDTGTSGVFDTTGLNESQLKTYEWAKKQGAQSDQSGVFIDNGGYRHYINLNSGISTTGVLQKENILGTFKLSGDRASEIVNGGQAELSQSLALGELSSKITKISGSGVLIDYDIPGTYYPAGMSGPAQIYAKSIGGIKYNLYKMTADGSSFNSILIGSIPTLDTEGHPIHDGQGRIVIPEENILNGTPKPGWAYLYLADGLRSRFKGKITTNVFHQYYTGVLKIGIADEASTIIASVLDAIRGEGEVSDSTLKSKISEVQRKFKSEVSKNTQEILGIGEESLKESIELYKSGKASERFMTDTDGTVIDKYLGINIGGKNGQFINPDQFIKSHTNDLARVVQDNFNKISVETGSIDLSGAANFERYKAMYGTDVFSRENVGRFKETLQKFGSDKLVQFGWTEDDGHGNRIFKQTKLRVAYDKDGKKIFKLEPNGDYAALKALMGNRETYTESELREIKAGEFSKNSTALGDVDYSSLESFVKTSGMSEERARGFYETYLKREGYSKLYNDPVEQARRQKLLEKYNTDNTDTSFSISKEGYLLHTDSRTGNVEVIGEKSKDGKFTSFQSESKFSDASIKNNTESRDYAFRQKMSWYASKYGAKPLGDWKTGDMYIDIDDGTRYKFNILDLGANDNIESIINSSSGQFFKKGSGQKGDGNFFDESWAEFDPANSGFGGRDEARLDSIKKKITEGVKAGTNQKDAFEKTWDAMALQDRMAMVESGDNAAAQTAYLSSMEEIEQDQLEALKLIAKNTAGVTEQDLDKLGNRKSIAEKQKEDAARKAAELAGKTKTTKDSSVSNIPSVLLPERIDAIKADIENSKVKTKITEQEAENTTQMKSLVEMMTDYQNEFEARMEPFYKMFEDMKKISENQGGGFLVNQNNNGNTTVTNQTTVFAGKGNAASYNSVPSSGRSPIFNTPWSPSS